jgi:hypothetical protein
VLSIIRISDFFIAYERMRLLTAMSFPLNKPESVAYMVMVDTGMEDTFGAASLRCVTWLPVSATTPSTLEATAASATFAGFVSACSCDTHAAVRNRELMSYTHLSIIIKACAACHNRTHNSPLSFTPTKHPQTKQGIQSTVPRRSSAAG